MESRSIAKNFQDSLLSPTIDHARAFRARGSKSQRHTSRNMAACANSGTITREVLNIGERKKIDEAVDSQFYCEAQLRIAHHAETFPRLVKHVDDSFLAAVTKLYRSAIPEGAEVLDLMSSWVSHLPEDRRYKRVVGHGMNAVELSRNKQLDHFFVRDLNAQPDNWAMADSSFDAVVCCVSVQYLQKPERVFAEIYRVLKPQGVCIITFSNRLYSTKAIQAWRDMANDYGRIQLVKQYFMCVSGFTLPDALRKMPEEVPPSGLLGWFSKARSVVQNIQRDPFYAVIAYKDSKPQK